MANETPGSTFFFSFRLSPWAGCLNLNFDQVELVVEFAAACTRDQLGILWYGDKTHFDTAQAQASTLARALIHAEAFLSFPNGIVLDVEPVSWLEVRDTGRPKKVVSGYMHESQASAPLNPNHPDKDRFREAGNLVRSLVDSVALQLALADFYTARREVGPYGAFYAYRVLEDVGLHFGSTKGGHPDWDKMNSALGTSETKWDLLKNAGTLARHLGGLSKPVERGALVALAREAITLVVGKIDWHGLAQFDTGGKK